MFKKIQKLARKNLLSFEHNVVKISLNCGTVIRIPLQSLKIQLSVETLIDVSAVMYA